MRNARPQAAAVVFKERERAFLPVLPFALGKPRDGLGVRTNIFHNVRRDGFKGMYRFQFMFNASALY